MGIRFEGPTIAHATSVDKGGADIISDGIAPGAIQVPGAGLPIVLLADRQTVGGYPKIATVASVDLPRLGRLLPGQTVASTADHVEEAEKLRRDQESPPARAIAGFVGTRAPARRHRSGSRLYEENLIDGIVYDHKNNTRKRRHELATGDGRAAPPSGDDEAHGRRRQGQAPARWRPAHGARAHRPAARQGFLPRDRQRRRQGRV